MKELKGWVRQKAQPKGCMDERYIREFLMEDNITDQELGVFDVPNDVNGNSRSDFE